MERLISDASKLEGIQKELNVTVKEGDLSFANIVNAVSVIQKKIGITGTTAKEASETLQGSLNSFKSAWNNFLSGSGGLNQVIDTAKTLTKNVRRILKEALTTMAKDIKDQLLKNGFNNIVEALENIKAIGTKVFDLAMKYIPKILDVVAKLFNGIVDFSNKAVDKITGLKAPLRELKSEVDEQQKSWENLKTSRETSLESSNAEINNLQNLSDELQKITDGNGKVKEGYELRANYILNELNQALGTEYAMNGNIIEQYQDLKDNIDEIISKKRAEAYLNAYQQEYQEALTKSNEASAKYIQLLNEYKEAVNKFKTSSGTAKVEAQQTMYALENELTEQKNLLDEYGNTVTNYENLVSATANGTADEIEEAMNRMGQSYKDAKTDMTTSLSDQITEYSKYRKSIRDVQTQAILDNNTYLTDILTDTSKAYDKKMQETIQKLKEESSAIEGLTDDQKKAWKTLAENDVQAYAEALSDLDEDTRRQIQNVTNVWATDESIEEQSEKLAKEAKEKFNDNTVGTKDGEDMVDNLKKGMTSDKSEKNIKLGAGLIAQWIKNILGHSVPKEGPLKDELKYMPDMIDNLAKGIVKNKSKITKATGILASEIEKKLSNAVNIETNKLSANATLKSNANYNSVISLVANFDGSVEMDSTKVGRITAPSVARTIKAGGLA